MKYAGLIGLMMVASSQAQTDIQKKQYSLSLSDPTQPMQLEVQLHNGSAHVIGYDGDTVEVSARMTSLSELQMKKRKQMRSNRGMTHVQESDKPKRSTEGLTPVTGVSFNLEIEESNNVVEIESNPGSFNVILEIKVPRTAHIDIEIFDGDYAKVDNISGTIEVETWRGDVQFNNIDGPVVAETHLHDIVASFASFDSSEPSSFTTFGGDIDVTVNPDVAMTLNLRNYEGEILSGLDAQFTPVDKVDKNIDKDNQKIVLGAQLSATLNSGEQTLSLSSYKGDMYLRKAN